jgi:phage baseplate assembly protein W
MSQKGFTGISFPFRFSGRGGVATSTTSTEDFSHIEESLRQILGTAIGERIFEIEFGSDVRQFNFKNQTDPTEISRLKFYISEAVAKFDNRVEILDVQVTPMESGSGAVIVSVDFHVKKYLQQGTINMEMAGDM